MFFMIENKILISTAFCGEFNTDYASFIWDQENSCGSKIYKTKF
jgi:hypothetical protein